MPIEKENDFLVTTSLRIFKSWAEQCAKKGYHYTYVFRKGLDFLENPPKEKEELYQRIAFLNGIIEEKNKEIDNLKDEIKESGYESADIGGK